jgi:hypothetical protein
MTNISKKKWAILILPLTFLIIVGCLQRLMSGIFLNDQAELVVFSQTPQILYDEQMPILTWLMSALFKATNYFILWPDFYKYLCLALVIWAIFDIGYTLSGKFYLAIISAFSLFFLPTFHADMLSEVTHTAALLMATAVSTALLIRFQNSNSAKRLLMGLTVCWLIGLLAKHTMVFVILAQITAYILAYKPNRIILMRVLKTALITALLIAPFYMLLILGKDTVDNGMQEFVSAEGFASGLIDLPESILSEGALFILGVIIIAICSLVNRRRQPLKKTTPIPFNSDVRFLILTSSFILLCFIPFIILGDIAVVRDRWLVPALMLWGPLFSYTFLCFKDKTAQITAIIFSIFVCCIGLYSALEPKIKAKGGSVERDTWPIAQMSRDIRANHRDIDNIIAFDDNLVATLKRQDPYLNIYSIKTKNNFQRDVTNTFIIIRETNSRPVQICQSAQSAM